MGLFDNQKPKPVKRVAVSGCRDYNNYNEAEEYISLCLSNIAKENRVIIVSGGCKGADKLGEMYATKHGLKIEQYLPNWNLYGRSAGPKRNKQMAEVSDYVICFWDGESRGTKSMIEFAKQLGKPTRVKNIKKL